MGKGRNATGNADSVKTSIRLPRKLWRDAQIRAMDENLEFQEVVARALEQYLKT